MVDIYSGFFFRLYPELSNIHMTYANIYLVFIILGPMHIICAYKSPNSASFLNNPQLFPDFKAMESLAGNGSLINTLTK